MRQSLRLIVDRTKEHTTSGASYRSLALRAWEEVLTAREADVVRVSMVLDMTPIGLQNHFGAVEASRQKITYNGR